MPGLVASRTPPHTCPKAGVSALGVGPSVPSLPSWQALSSGGFKAGQMSVFSAGRGSGKSMLGMSLLLEEMRRREEEARRLAERVKQLDEAFPHVPPASPRPRM